MWWVTEPCINPCIYFALKLVLLEWSEGKSDCKFGFSMLKNPLRKILGQLGQPVVLDSTLLFSLDDTCMWFREAAPIITHTTGVILSSNFWYQDKEINRRISIKYGRDNIAWKLFQDYVTMKENNIQNFRIEFNGAWIENNLRVSSCKNLHMLSNATGCPNCSKICSAGFFNMLNPNLPSDLLADYSSNKSFKDRFCGMKCAGKIVLKGRTIANSAVAWPGPANASMSGLILLSGLLHMFVCVALAHFWSVIHNAKFFASLNI